MTEKGNEHLEQVLGAAGLLKGDNLTTQRTSPIVHHVQQALRAHKLFQRDKDYIVKDNQVSSLMNSPDV